MTLQEYKAYTSEYPQASTQISAYDPGMAAEGFAEFLDEASEMEIASGNSLEITVEEISGNKTNFMVYGEFKPIYRAVQIKPYKGDEI